MAIGTWTLFCHRQFAYGLASIMCHWGAKRNVHNANPKLSAEILLCTHRLFERTVYRPTKILYFISNFSTFDYSQGNVKFNLERSSALLKSIILS
jgi:hypothetical protein